ncbi:MAG: DNA polymerase elongation subunit, partial [Deltaproteobacteria bacterium]|nr:DNA polymerase elongation subunit [Deltaproteobacteria bacterium]
MMEIQVLDVDYILVDEKPIIRIFGKKMDGKTVCVFYEDYKPYFYADDERALDLIKNNSEVIKTEKVKRKRVMGYSDPVDMWKITLQNPSKTPEIRDMIHSRGLRTYESDILFKYRFMNDFGIKGLGWIKIKDTQGRQTVTVNTDQSVMAKKIEPIEKNENAPLKFLAFDIECIPTVPGTLQEGERDPLIMISAVFSEEFKGNRSMVVSTRPGKGVTAVSTEEDMIKKFMEIISQYDPDVITGYNINNFDLPFILERMKKYRIRSVMGRCTQKPVIAKKLMARYRMSAVGRIFVDSFEIIKKDFSFMRYDLGTVSKNLLNDSKIPVKVSEMDGFWRGDQEGFDRFVEYCKKDSTLAMDLVVKIRLMDKYIALSKISGTLIQDTLASGETQRIENFLLQEFNKRGFVFPCRPSNEAVAERELSRKKELRGGFVLEPDKGLHDNVVVLDFKSMYPSIIRTFNVCPTTMITDKKVDNPITTVTGTSFVPKTLRMGIIPTILEALMKRRGLAKKKMNNAKDENRKRVYDAEQWALKIMANAFYGHMGYSRARIYDIRIGNVITGSGRDMIHKTKDMVEKEFGHRVVYGDTDSVMVKINMD